MHVCLVYDHVFPQTLGGGERWMRDLALSLASRDHEVTYLTMRHWEGDDPPQLDGVTVVGVASAGVVYREDRRTLGPPLRFGLAVARHLARHGRRYDIVHTASFPYFPVLAAAALRRRGGYRLVVDWLEVWTRNYWRRYAGVLAGSAGWFVQRACVRVRHHANCISHLTAERLRAEGYRGIPTVLPGLYAGPTTPAPAADVDADLVVYAGRHVREKRLDLLVRAFALALARRPGLRLELYGDGPDRGRIEQLTASLALGNAVRFVGKRPEDELASALGRAACVATASEREGYGLIVIEAAARGTPSVVVAGPENAATELVEDGVNGAVAPAAVPGALAEAILRVVRTGAPLRAATERWFQERADSLTVAASLDLVLRGYGVLEARATAPVTT